MEIIVVLVFVVALGAWIWYRQILDKDNETNLETLAPYKIETPPSVGKSADDRVESVAPTPSNVEAKRCGCGRSVTGFCVGLHQLTPAQWAEHPDNPKKPTPPAKKTAAKKTAAKKASTVSAEKPELAKKTAARKTIAKKPKV